MKHLSKEELFSQMLNLSASNSNTYEKEREGQKNEADPVESSNTSVDTETGGEQDVSIDDAQQNVEPSKSNQAAPLNHDEQGEAISPDLSSEQAPASQAVESSTVDTPDGSPEVNEVANTDVVTPDVAESQPLAVDSNQESTSGANTRALVCAKSLSMVPAQNTVEIYLSNSQPLDVTLFPHQPRKGSSRLPATIENTDYLLHKYNIIPRYNVIKKKLMITIPGHTGTIDNEQDVTITRILSLAALSGLSTKNLPAFILALADMNPYNSVADWILGKPWDGKDRLPDICDTITEREDFSEGLKNILICKWLLSAVAAALMPRGFKARGVLTLQGPQSIGKTSWLLSLVSDSQLCDAVVKVDHHLDGSNKDSILNAISHWLVEVGELESSFKKDIARLKGFLTSNFDKIRRPYGRGESEYQRRTVFMATVNQPDFLVDNTGNSRWWTIPVIKIDYNHGIDMQQVFAQLAVDLGKGLQWWLTPEEEAMLNACNLEHRSISVIRERLLEKIDLDLIGKDGNPAMTASQVLEELDYAKPTNGQCKECAAILRELLGAPKKIKGLQKYRIPLKRFSDPITSIEDDE